MNPTLSSALNYVRARDSAERGASHIENIISGELIQGGRNAALATTYSYLAPSYTLNSGQPNFSWGWRDLNFLNGPYLSEGYLNDGYKLGDIQK